MRFRKKEQGTYIIESKNVRVILEAPDRKTAWRMFFARVRENGWGRTLGMIAMMKPPWWKSEGDSIGMKTYPTLWNMKLVDWDTLVSSLALYLEISEAEAGLMMKDHIKKDGWAMPAEAIRLD